MCLQIFIHAFHHFRWRGGGANDPAFSVDLTRSRAIFRDPEILYIIRGTCSTSQGDPDSSFPYGIGRCHLAFAVANCVLNWRFAVDCSDCWKLRQLLEAATGCRWGPQYDGKCSFYFNYFFRTPPANRDVRQKAVYFLSRPLGMVARNIKLKLGYQKAEVSDWLNLTVKMNCYKKFMKM